VTKGVLHISNHNCILRFAKKNFLSELRFFIEEKRTKLLKKNSRVIVMYIPLNLGQEQGGLLRLKSKYLYKTMAEMKNLVFFSCTQCTHRSTQMYTNDIKNKNRIRKVL
jgi:hypothetical protein